MLCLFNVYFQCVCRGQVEVGDAEEAIETILTHVGRPVDLVRRKVVTKEVIFRYLHHQKVAF